MICLKWESVSVQALHGYRQPKAHYSSKHTTAQDNFLRRCVFLCLHLYVYVGVVKESQEWVEPIVSKKDLQKAFKDYIKPPSIIEKVQKLSEYVSLEFRGFNDLTVSDNKCQ